MNPKDSSWWFDGCIGLIVFSLNLLSGISIVAYGRTDIGGAFLFAGILVALLALVYYWSRQKPLNHLFTTIAVAVLVAIVGIVAFTVAADAIIHAGGINPEPVSPVPGITGPWSAPDADLGSVDQTPLCHGYLYPVETEGYVYLGEGCLNIAAGVSSGQRISWYRNSRNSEKDRPDESRVVQDARNFYVNPDEFAGYEGPWYIGTTDKVAFFVNRDTNAQMTTPGSFEDSGKFDAGVSAIINSTNQIDSARVWVVLEEPSGIERDPGTNLTPEEKAVFREQQRAYYLNYTKPVVDYVRAKGFVVDYISQTSPSFEVLAPPPFMEELAQQPTVRKIVVTKASHELIKEMLQRQPDETLRLMISLTKPPGVTRWPGTLTEEQTNEYYSKNRVLFENHTRSILDLLEKENINIQYDSPYPTGGFWAEVPVYLIEEFNARSDIVYMVREIPAYLV